MVWLEQPYLPLHAVYVGGSKSHLSACLAWVALSAVNQVILSLKGVECAWLTGHGVTGALRTVETSRTLQTVLHTWTRGDTVMTLL